MTSLGYALTPSAATRATAFCGFSSSASVNVSWVSSTLARKVNRPKFTIYTTKPGIFVFKNEVMTKKELYDKDVIESGGFTFQYYAEKHRMKEKQQGKDILEGRM